MYRFIIDNIMKQIDLGIDTSVCYCLGTGKNESFLQQVNAGHHFFQKIVALEHPRYIMQYKAKRKDEYIRKYLNAFKSVI
jgi:hypothetical protein